MSVLSLCTIVRTTGRSASNRRNRAQNHTIDTVASVGKRLYSVRVRPVRKSLKPLQVSIKLNLCL